MSEREADEQQAEASNLATSAWRLKALCADPALRNIVASNPAAPANLLNGLAQDADAQVRKSVAGNPNTPWDTLEALAWEFPAVFLHNPVGPIQMLAYSEQMNIDEAFGGVLLRAASIPPVWWNWLLGHPKWSVGETMRLHVQYAGETTHPCGLREEENEHTLLILTELLTAACISEGSLSQQNSHIYEPIIREGLQRLAQSRDSKMREAVVSNEYTPVETLRMLAQDADEVVRRAVAESPLAPAEALLALATDQKPWIRGAVVNNRRTPVEVLRILATDDDSWILSRVIRNPQTPLEVVQALDRNKEALACYAGGMHNLGPALFENQGKRSMMASDEHTPLETLALLAQDPHEGVRVKVAANLQTPAEMLQTLAQDQDWQVRIAVAKNPETPADVLQALSIDRDLLVRSAVFSNPQTSEETLLLMAQDSQKAVRMAVAKNPQVPVGVLRILARDANVRVRWVVANHPKTPVETLRILAEDDYHEVRRSVFLNPRTPMEVLAFLTQDGYEDLRLTAAANARTPAETLARLAQDDYDDGGREPAMIRLMVASNPQTPGVVLRTLAQDANARVRSQVALRPQLPMEILHTLAQDQNNGVRWHAKFVLKLLNEVEGPLREQAWWKNLHGFFLSEHNGCRIVDSSIEKQLAGVVSLDIPDSIRQILLATFAADWDRAKVSRAFTVFDNFLSTTISREQREDFRCIMVSFMPAIALQKLAASPRWEVRCLVALHEQTPWETRQALCQDGNRYVRAIAKVRMETLEEQI